MILVDLMNNFPQTDQRVWIIGIDFDSLINGFIFTPLIFGVSVLFSYASLQFCRELHPVGSRALSHESIFIPEEALRELAQNHSMSQENVSDKVKHLQVRPLGI